MLGTGSSKYRAAFLARKNKKKPLPKPSMSEKLMTKETPIEDEVVKKPNTVDKKSLFIIRHGKTALDPTHRSDGWLDLPLTDDGRVRLLTAQQFLKDIPLTRIYAPDFKRTMETAEIIASGNINHPKVITASDDSKTWNLGVFMGTQKKPNKPKVQSFMDHPDKVPEGGESYNDFKSRFDTWLGKIKQMVLDGQGPFLLCLSGSNCREISLEMTGERDTLDLDEGGLMELTPSTTKGGWTAKVLFGHKDENNEWLS